MVTFMCDGCQATLKKNKVDGHFSRGRCASASVSCVDCGVTFWGDDYAVTKLVFPRASCAYSARNPVPTGRIMTLSL